MLAQTVVSTPWLATRQHANVQLSKPTCRRVIIIHRNNQEGPRFVVFIKIITGLSSWLLIIFEVKREFCSMHVPASQDIYFFLLEFNHKMTRYKTWQTGFNAVWKKWCHCNTQSLVFARKLWREHGNWKPDIVYKALLWRTGDAFFCIA